MTNAQWKLVYAEDFEGARTGRAERTAEIVLRERPLVVGLRAVLLRSAVQSPPSVSSSRPASSTRSQQNAPSVIDFCLRRVKDQR